VRRIDRATGALLILLLVPTAAVASPSKASWSILSTPNPPGAKHAVLWDVACATATDCMAVGSYDVASRTSTLAQHWDGATWRALDTPNPPHSQGALLTGVWCAPTGACIAVGFWNKPNADYVPFAESWDGAAWSIRKLPAPPGSSGAVLFQLACKDAQACTAVGTYFTRHGGHLRPFIERWDGSSWSQQYAPMPRHATDAQLLDVSCATASDCVAVGLRDFIPGRTLVERWDGSTWSVVPSPNPNDPRFPGALLASVSCSSPDSCVAVGESRRLRDGKEVDRSLVERWDGSTWSVEKVPVEGNSGLWAVRCVHENDCMAVGVDRGRPLAQRWNGTTWTLQAPPMPPGAHSATLWGVACQAATECIAVGSDTAGKGETLAERYSR
jgi:hypothetical protein